MTSVIASVRCNYCSRQLPPFRVHSFGPPEKPAQTLCDDCLNWHFQALEMLAGRGIASGCQKCGTTTQILAEKSPGVEMRLYVVPRDGLYQVLCKTCVLPYAQLRADLYRGTAFGNLIF